MEQIEEKSFGFSHVGVIMDGNRRWARARNLDVVEGHKAGSNVFKESIKWCIELGVKEYTVYAFSCENWNRTEKEVRDLMNLFTYYTDSVIETMENDYDSIYNKVQLRFIGRIPSYERDRFSSDFIQRMEKLENRSKNNTMLKVNVCLDYSGQWDIAQSCKKLMTRYHADMLLEDDISKDIPIESVIDELAKNLSTGDSPVDLVIRTGGEFRISNFLLWQIAYAEIYVLDDFWPDFTFDKFREVLMAVKKRNRRFGK